MALFEPQHQQQVRKAGMALIKFCAPEHNPARASHLRLGTLYGYRHIENPELRDGGEGNYDFTVTFRGEVSVDARWSNLLMGGLVHIGPHTAHFPGEFRASAGPLNIVKTSENGMVLRDTVVRVTRTVPNCLMFCMSSLPEDAISPFESYADRWVVPDVKARDIGGRIGWLLTQHIDAADFCGLSSMTHGPGTAGPLTVDVEDRPVIYRDRQLTITEQSHQSYDELLQILQEIHFVKPKQFEAEHEHRFCFSLHDEQRIYEPERELYLPLRVLAGL